MGNVSAEQSDQSAKNSAPLAAVDIRQTIADQMEALAIELRTFAADDVDTIPTEATLLALANSLYGARRQIDNVFDMQGFAVSPAWDIVLDLYQARAKGLQISVSSACIGSACPATTGLRWLQALEKLQLVERRQDPADGRRVTVMLTEKGVQRTVEALRLHLRG